MSKYLNLFYIFGFILIFMSFIPNINPNPLEEDINQLKKQFEFKNPNHVDHLQLIKDELMKTHGYDEYMKTN